MFICVTKLLRSSARLGILQRGPVQIETRRWQQARIVLIPIVQGIIAAWGDYTQPSTSRCSSRRWDRWKYWCKGQDRKLELSLLCLSGIRARTVKINGSPSKNNRPGLTHNDTPRASSACFVCPQKRSTIYWYLGCLRFNSGLLGRLHLRSQAWSWLSISHHASEKTSQTLFIFYIWLYLYQILCGLLHHITERVLLFQSVSGTHFQIFLSWSGALIYTVHT